MDTAAGKAYWANSTGFGTLSGADADGSGNGFDLTVSDVSAELPTGIALDPDSGRIYWGNRNGGRVGMADLDGSNGSFLDATGATALNAMYPVLLKVPVAAGSDLAGEFLYRVPESFAYQWLLDGAEIPGATSAAYSPEQAGSYSCRVSATSGAGTTSQTSDAVQVDEPLDTVIDGSASAKRKQKQKGKKIVVKVNVKAGEDLDAKATGKVKAKKSYKLKPTSKGVRSDKRKTLKLKPKKSKDAKKIQEALKRGKLAKAEVKVKLTDEAGNRETEMLNVKLKR